MSFCLSRLGFSQRCQRQPGHDGPHDSGHIQWTDNEAATAMNPLKGETLMMCQCGHDRCLHDYRDGCRQFLCCDRTRNLTPGRRHQEHDGVNHKAQGCPCTKYQEGAA